MNVSPHDGGLSHRASHVKVIGSFAVCRLIIISQHVPNHKKPSLLWQLPSDSTGSIIYSYTVDTFSNCVFKVFHLTAHSFALVNLKPLLPGHVLVSPLRVTPRLADLTYAEVTDLFLTVQHVGRMLERVYGASSLNIAIQDGVDAGQSVPHLHTHIIPRKKQDLEDKGGNDAIYSMLEGKEGDIGKYLQEGAGARPKFPTVDDEARQPRSKAQMAEEAQRLAMEMDKSL